MERFPMPQIPANIKGAEQLVRVFGYWPSFHDAEVLRFSVDRYGEHGPTVECVIHVYEGTKDIDPEGLYILKNHSLVTFRFLAIVELEVSDFNQQNVLWDLEIINIEEPQLEQVKFSVMFPASFGMSASFQCLDVEVVRVERCDREGNPQEAPICELLDKE